MAASLSCRPACSTGPSICQRKGAINLHLLLDHEGDFPSFAVVTDGKHSELKVAQSLSLEAGTILAIDRGYKDYEWFGQLPRAGFE